MPLNVTTVYFAPGQRKAYADRLVQWDRGQILKIEGLNLPNVFEVHFSNSKIEGKSKTQIGENEEVEIPDQYLKTGEKVYAWIYLHEGAEDGATKRFITIPIDRRPEPDDTPPDQEEQSVTAQLITAMNNAVEQSTEDAERAAGSASSAAESALTASEKAGEASSSASEASISARTANTAVGKAENAVTHYPKIDAGTWWVWDVTEEEWVDTGVEAHGDPGSDGYSPEITVQSITGGHTVTITDKTGDHAFNVMDGGDYVLTQQDKEDIAALVDVPGADFHICASGEYDPVTRMPTVRDPETNVFYLVPAEDGSSPDMFVEWIYANTAWEMFGSAAIDLNNYATKTDLNGKVDKVTGKGLSENDYTNAEKNKLAGIEVGANKIVVDSALSAASTNPVQNKVVDNAIKAKADITDLAPVYDSTATYEAGDYVTYNGNIYRCTTAIDTAEDWTAAHWTQVAIGAELTRYNEDITELSGSIAPVESTATATAAHAVGELFMMGETLLVALSAIAVGDTITTEGGSPNAAVTTLSSKLLKDVQVNGTSVVTDDVANVPLASNAVVGVVQGESDNGITILNTGKMRATNPSDAQIKEGTVLYRKIGPAHQHASTFYGLAKAAGSDEKNSSLAVGTYTDAAKVAIQKMLGIYEAPWELIREDTFTNAEAAAYDVTVDSNGQTFELTDIRIVFWTPQQETEAAVGNYGRVKCYFAPGTADVVYIGAYTQVAGAGMRISHLFIEQKNGMIERGYTNNLSSGNNVVFYGNNAAVEGVNSIWQLTKKVYTKIQFELVKGTANYRIYGKRKWS